MIKAAGCRGAAILLSLFLTAAAVTGCGGKYEHRKRTASRWQR